MDDLELALDDCLQRLASGKSSLAQCLARYPQYAAELRPLLETALRLQQGKDVRPTGALRDRARAELADYIQSHPQRGRRERNLPKLAMGVLIVVCLLALGGTAFAQAALPGQILYALKLSTERAWRSAAPDPVSADLTLADRRANELIMLGQQNSMVVDVSAQANAESQGIAAYNDVLNRLGTETDGPNGDRILMELQGHQTALSHAGIHIPKLDDIISQAHSQKNHNPKNTPQP